jgi:hypothetical protein
MVRVFRSVTAAACATVILAWAPAPGVQAGSPTNVGSVDRGPRLDKIADGTVPEVDIWVSFAGGSPATDVTVALITLPGDDIADCEEVTTADANPVAFTHCSDGSPIPAGQIVAVATRAGESSAVASECDDAPAGNTLVVSLTLTDSTTTVPEVDVLVADAVTSNPIAGATVTVDTCGDEVTDTDGVAVYTSCGEIGIPTGAVVAAAVRTGWHSVVRCVNANDEGTTTLHLFMTSPTSPSTPTIATPTQPPPSIPDRTVVPDNPYQRTTGESFALPLIIGAGVLGLLILVAFVALLITLILRGRRRRSGPARTAATYRPAPAPTAATVLPNQAHSAQQRGTDVVAVRRRVLSPVVTLNDDAES